MEVGGDYVDHLDGRDECSGGGKGSHPEFRGHPGRRLRIGIVQAHQVVGTLGEPDALEVDLAEVADADESDLEHRVG